MKKQAVATVLRYRLPLRFGVVGVVGVTLNSCVLFILISRSTPDPVLAGGIATGIAIWCNFVFNDLWTFRTPTEKYRRPWLSRALRYNAIAAGGWCVSVGTLAVMIHLVNKRLTFDARTTHALEGHLARPAPLQ